MKVLLLCRILKPMLQGGHTFKPMCLYNLRPWWKDGLNSKVYVHVCFANRSLPYVLSLPKSPEVPENELVPCLLSRRCSCSTHRLTTRLAQPWKKKVRMMWRYVGIRTVLVQQCTYPAWHVLYSIIRKGTWNCGQIGLLSTFKWHGHVWSDYVADYGVQLYTLYHYYIYTVVIVGGILNMTIQFKNTIQTSASRTSWPRPVRHREFIYGNSRWISDNDPRRL
jgi:hypothetical protein